MRPLRIYVYSRGAIEALPAPAEPHAVVSITSGIGDRARIPESPSTRGILRLVFADADVASDLIPASALFTRDQARSIWRFVLEHRSQMEELRVHCDAGQCRSPAVGAAVAKVLLGDDEEFFRRYRPNRFVFRSLLETWADEFSQAAE